ncbi:hypothetical protein HMN09_00271100 [Mycena chlorophos]|uniref:Sodium/calcium exchanger membrane region domain-containing protein n=1 Tax=Mycena chlorophos TaxID=658473 RepID=A0A8H6TKP4_MYCCL|nr:hypothetical protein HMN09_00271100 [Mycena chlorophos]
MSHTDEDNERPLVPEETNGIPLTTVPTTTSMRARWGQNVFFEDAPRPGFTLPRAKTSLFTPERPVGKAPGVGQELRTILTLSYFNVLLVFVPISWVYHWVAKDHYTLIIIFSFLGIIALSKLLAFAIEDLALRVGSTLGRFLQATVGNLVELMIALQIIALSKCGLTTVLSSLIGSILSNLLLVLGMCFFFGGLRYSQQGFGQDIAALDACLLTLSVISILLPATFRFLADEEIDPRLGKHLLKVSRGVAIVLFCLYIAYLFFQVYSHAQLYDEMNRRITQEGKQSQKYMPRTQQQQSETEPELGSAPTSSDKQSNHEEEEENPHLSVPMALGLFIVSTTLAAFTAIWLVDATLVASGLISKGFADLILLPIAGNIADHIVAVAHSISDRLSRSIHIAVGSSISISLFLAVLAVIGVLQLGKANWLNGIILICLYIILAITVFYYPGTEPQFANVLPACN